ncbi:MAG: hypothetical protein QOD26_3161 [Betaproteobacteria bacterium]|nr:hypothetical protein [Betaproteobacteria bacterium]
MRRALGTVLAVLRLLAGSLAFVATGRTSSAAYQSMIRLFMLTGGWSNDVAARWLSVLHPPRRRQSASGVLGNLNAGALDRLDAQLRNDGYAVFERALPADLCDRLLDFALRQPAKVRASDRGPTPPAGEIVYDRANPRGIIYDFHPQVLVNQPDFQRLMSDASIVALAERYLGVKPVLDTVNLWWTAKQGATPDSNAAQLWHFDMDRVRWVKFFMYLTEVTPESGPHCFIAGSHRTGGIPRRLRDKGYVRLTDQDVAAEYSPQAVKTFTAPRGTILVEDTRGLHKGLPVLRGDRLMLEFEFSNSLFGGNPAYPAKIVTHHGDFAQFVKANRRQFERWQ